MPMNKAVSAHKPHKQLRGGKRPLYAAVDLGTNNCRLLIAYRHGAHFRVLASHSQIVRLGEGLAATGQLSEAAMERTFDALGNIRAKLGHHHVGNVRCIATEACRKAENGPAFIRQVQARTGLSFKIVSAGEEARLAAIGCHDLLEPEADLVMVLDIGGGSTEVSFLDLTQLRDRNLKDLVRSVPIKASRSFPLGVVTLSESFAEGDEAQVYSAQREHARSLFASWTQGAEYCERMAERNAYMVGTSGTVTCLAGIHLNLPRYERRLVDGLWMDDDQVHAVIDQLREIGPAGRAALPTVGSGRADLMMAGCAILDAACELWPSGRLRVADRGLREGLLLSMIHRQPKPSRRRRARNGSDRTDKGPQE